MLPGALPVSNPGLPALNSVMCNPAAAGRKEVDFAQHVDAALENARLSSWNWDFGYRAQASSTGQNLGHRHAKFARTGSHGQAVGLHDFRLFGGAVAACRNDRAGMAHAAAFWRREAGDIADHRFGHVALDPRRRLGFLGATDFA